MNATFDHRDIGTSEAVWRAAGLDELPSVAATGGRLVVLAAHPDDETLGAGGLIAASARLGAEITVLIATDGEASHPSSSTHTPVQLAVLRRAEVDAALARLAPTAIVRRLGLPDGRLADFGPSLDAALAAATSGEAALLVSPFLEDGHPDHAACARAAQRLARSQGLELWQYPIWAWHWGDPASSAVPLQRCRRLPLGPDDLAAKQAALAEHVSQHEPLSPLPGDEPILSPQLLTHFGRSAEFFVLDRAPAASASYFDDLYARSADPWGLADRFYERRKRELVLASLPGRRFRRAFEPGCASGLLTARLAQRCDEVVAWDAAEAAVSAARAFLGDDVGRVQLGSGHIPAQWPAGVFDLVVLSEVGYYCDDLHALTDRVLASLSEDGVVLGCHWRRRADDHPRTAEEVHAALGAVLTRVVRHEEGDFLLEVWSRDGRSVAEAEGIV